MKACLSAISSLTGMWIIHRTFLIVMSNSKATKALRLCISYFQEYYIICNKLKMLLNMM